MTVTALWTPEIAPPDHWLMPAVLYQDRISTFAPEPYLQSADGREARRLAAILGELYEPLHFHDFQGNDLTALILSRKDLWIATVESDYRLTGRPHLHEWLQRIQSWNKRSQDIERHARVLETGLETAKRSLADAQARRSQSDTTLNGHISQLEGRRLKLQSELQEQRRQRAERLQPLIERRQALIKLRRECHRQQVPFLKDAELEAVTAEIRE